MSTRLARRLQTKKESSLKLSDINSSHDHKSELRLSKSKKQSTMKEIRLEKSVPKQAPRIQSSLSRQLSPLDKIKQNQQTKKMLKKVTREVIINSQRNLAYDDFLAVFTSPKLSSEKKFKIEPQLDMGQLDDKMVTAFINDIFEEEDLSESSSDYNPNSKRARLKMKKLKEERTKENLQPFLKKSTMSPQQIAQERSSRYEFESKLKYDKEVFHRMLASLDLDKLNEQNIFQLRNQTKDRFGFYDKLCIVADRVKVFNDLFNRRPKYHRERSQKKPMSSILSPFKTMKTFKRKTVVPDFLQTLNQDGRGLIKQKLSLHFRQRLVIPSAQRKNRASKNKSSRALNSDPTWPDETTHKSVRTSNQHSAETLKKAFMSSAKRKENTTLGSHSKNVKSRSQILESDSGDGSKAARNGIKFKELKSDDNSPEAHQSRHFVDIMIQPASGKATEIRQAFRKNVTVQSSSSSSIQSLPIRKRSKPKEAPEKEVKISPKRLQKIKEERYFQHKKTPRARLTDQSFPSMHSRIEHFNSKRFNKPKFKNQNQMRQREAKINSQFFDSNSPRPGRINSNSTILIGGDGGSHIQHSSVSPSPEVKEVGPSRNILMPSTDITQTKSKVLEDSDPISSGLQLRTGESSIRTQTEVQREFDNSITTNPLNINEAEEPPFLPAINGTSKDLEFTEVELFDHPVIKEPWKQSSFLGSPIEDTQSRRVLESPFQNRFKKERYATKQMLEPIFKHQDNLKTLARFSRTNSNFQTLQSSLNGKLKKFRLNKEMSLRQHTSEYMFAGLSSPGNHMSTEPEDNESKGAFQRALQTYQFENQSIESKLVRSKEKLRKLQAEIKPVLSPKPTVKTEARTVTNFQQIKEDKPFIRKEDAPSQDSLFTPLAHSIKPKDLRNSLRLSAVMGSKFTDQHTEKYTEQSHYSQANRGGSLASTNFSNRQPLNSTAIFEPNSVTMAQTLDFAKLANEVALDHRQLRMPQMKKKALGRLKEDSIRQMSQSITGQQARLVKLFREKYSRNLMQ